MLAFARRQPAAERVRWVEGDARALGTPEADLLVMTGNVAQVFLDDADWRTTLAASLAALRPGGSLAFESRNPEDRAWERWNRAATYARSDPPAGPMERWLALVRAGDGRGTFDGHYRFLSTGEAVVTRSELRFRGLKELTDSVDRRRVRR